jgi:hypothetical protein
LTQFSIAHDETYIIPAVREALAIDLNVFTLATPWTPPTWMKANDAFDHVGRSGPVLPQYYPALADDFVKFIEDYQTQGVPIDAITPMNEPRATSPGQAQRSPPPMTPPSSRSTSPRRSTPLAFTRSSSDWTTPSYPTRRRCGPVRPAPILAASRSTATKD